MAKRRSNGEGSYWQLPDRTWVHQITIGRKEDGTLQRKSLKGRTKAICKERKEEWLAQQEAAQKQAEAAQKETANRETQRIAILTDLFVGYRVGELLALEISDLDLERQTLTVNKNLIRVPTEALSLNNPNIRILNYDPNKKIHLIVQSTPKTRSSNRETFISDGLCELLVRHIFTMAQSSWPNPDNLLFPSKTGTYIDPKSFEIRLKAVSQRCGIRKVNPHALRHTLATRLVEEKVPLNIVQGILGHSSIETTRKYLHKNEDIEREAIGTMSGYLDTAKLVTAPTLNGAKKRNKFAAITLPDFSQPPSTEQK